MIAIAFELDSRLPALSWCARARPGMPITVRHGAGVETRRDGFVEGAWNGPFDAFDFDTATTFTGTGGRLRSDVLVFAAPSHPLERLFALQCRDATFVSNSLAFLLTEAGESLDLSYPNYFFDLVRQVRRGIAPPPTRLRTASDARIELYPCCNLMLRPDLSLRRVDKPLDPPPADYAEYHQLLLSTTRSVADNARSPERKSAYRLVAACSRGYDSTACAALASLAGCREGVTFARSARRTGRALFGMTERFADDSGAEALTALGMRVTTYERMDLNQVPGHPRAEFFLNPATATDVAARVMEEQLALSLFVSGRHGERYWGLTRRSRRKNFREIDDVILSGHAFGEFRLRVGFFHFPIAYVGARHGPAIFRITHSPEMRPWKLGTGYYDRPIPRRIAEDAGVPRHCFGHEKRGGTPGDRGLGPASAADFQEFLRVRVPDAIRRRLDPRPLGDRSLNHRRLANLRTHYAHLPLASRAMDWLQLERLHMLWNSTALYQFHWGCEKTQERYRK
jgi:hypothetical protein